VDNLARLPAVLHHDVVTVTDLAEAIGRLRAAGCVFAEDEAAVLGAAAADPSHLSALIDRRAQGEPLEQVVGYADFCGVRVRLHPGVFVPRVRSELLVHTALAEIQQRAKTVVDLCCGSGALGLAVRRQAPSIRLLAADCDPVAVACALENLGHGVFQGDLFAALPDALRGRIDVLLANVPYVATAHLSFLPAEARLHEPRTALDGGADGLDVFRAVVAGAPGWLAPGGLLLSEITEAQTEAALVAVRAAGLCAAVVEDDDLEARAVTARLPQVPEVAPLR
jgi:release factor glutamine methyltransferase